MNALAEPLFRAPLLQDDFVEEFHHLDTVGVWTDTSGDTGASPQLSADGTSSVNLITAATDNNEAYLHTNRTWDIANGQPLVFEARVKFTEAATDDANVFAGISSAFGANMLLDNGAGPAASFSGFGFYKVDGGTVWNLISSVGSTQTKTATTITAGGGWQSLRIEVRPVSSTKASVVFLIDPTGGSNFQVVLDSRKFPVSHEITYTSFAAADAGFGVKAGGATEETLYCDYLRVSQVK